MRGHHRHKRVSTLGQASFVRPLDSLHDIANYAIINVACEIYHFIIEVETVEISTILVIEYKTADTVVCELVNLDIGDYLEWFFTPSGA